MFALMLFSTHFHLNPSDKYFGMKLIITPLLFKWLDVVTFQLTANTIGKDCQINDYSSQKPLLYCKLSCNAMAILKG